MKNTILSEQIFDTPPPTDEDDQENNDNDTETTSLHCDHCKKPMGEWGFIHTLKLETTKQISFLCSKQCKSKHNNVKTCPQCGIEFRPQKNQKTCSHKCSSDFSKQKCGLCQCCGKQIQGFDRNKTEPKKYCNIKCASIMRSYRYNTHYFCDRNNHWVKIEDAKKPYPNNNNYFTCPEYSHNNNRLRTSSRKAKLNQKRRDNARRIE